MARSGSSALRREYSSVRAAPCLGWMPRRKFGVLMFLHPGFRPLWPVIFFLPWLLLGAAYLLQWVLHRRP